MTSDRRFGARSGLSSLVLSVGVTFCLAGCADVTRGPATPMPDAGGAAVDSHPSGGAGGQAGAGGGASGGLSYAAQVQPIVVGDCASCHSAGGSASSSGLLLDAAADANHAAVRALVDPANPAGSRLLSKAAGNGHGGGAVWPPGSPEATLVQRWISEGALP